MTQPKNLRISWPTTAWAIVLATSGCATLATQPTAAPVSIAGQWQLDVVNSDDFDRKLVPLLEIQRRRMLPRHGSVGVAGSRRGSENEDVEALIMPPEEPEKVRARLTAELRPPKTLNVVVTGDAVEIAGDAEPARRFLPGQSVSRIDTSGAASLLSGWDQRAFVVRARYTNRASRSWRYEVEPATGTLRVNFEADDSEFGKLTLQTQYRRAP